MASRYDTTGTNGTNNDSRVVSTGTGTTTSAGAQTGNTNSTTSQTTNQTQDTNMQTTNMSPSELAALNGLINKLKTGGSDVMKANTAARLGQVQFMQDSQSGYTKAAAFGDAQGLISQQMRRVLESLIPSINRAAEDAGSSGGALRALLMQDAAAKAAESSSALGVQTATNYGNISANMGQVIDRLTSGGDPAMEALLQALNVAKGSQTTTKGTVNTTGITTGNTQTQATQYNSSNSATNESKSSTTDYAPFAVANTTPTFYGPVADPIDPTKYIGTTMDTLSQLNGTGNPWAKYSF